MAETDAVWRRTWTSAAPWLLLVAVLYGSQVWAVFDSEFNMPILLLQVPFVLAFMVCIVAIAHDRIANA